MTETAPETAPETTGRDICAALVMHLVTPDLYPDTPSYRAALVRAALDGQPLPTDPETLRHLDAGLAAVVYALPARLDQADAHGESRSHLRALDQAAHDLRLRIAARMARHQARWTALERALYPEGQDTPQAPDAPGEAPDAPQEDDATRAARLLRAALTLIMQPPPDRPDGGQLARLTKPRPPMGPTPTAALRQPTTPVPSTAIDF
jgi:hypothetical protein